MEDSFDFRPYLETLWHRRWLLAGGALLAGLLGFGLSFLLPKTYEASALVIVQSASVSQTAGAPLTESLPPQVYPELATSDAVFQPLLAEIAPRLSEPDTMVELRQTTAVATARDPNLLRLTVRHRDAAAAALIASAWSELFVVQTNRLFRDQEQVTFYAGQRDGALRRLRAAEQAVADFQAGNRLRIATAELAAAESALAGYLARRQQLQAISQDLATWRAQLAAQDGALLPADQLPLLLLYLRTYGGDLTAVPLELQAGVAPADSLERSQLLAAQDALESALPAVAEEVAAGAAGLEPQILALQQQLQALTSEEERLGQDVLLATENYATLARQVTEAALVVEDASRGLRLVSAASVPEQPVAPLELVNGLLAALVTFVALVAVTAFRQWQRS